MKRILAYSLFLAFPLFSSCQKEADAIVCEDPASPVANSISAVLQEHRVPTQKFTVQPRVTTILTTAKGATIYVPSGLQRVDGTALSNNSIQVEVQEVTTRSEMVFMQLPTVSYGRALESGGMFNIRFSQDGQPLQLAAGTKLNLVTVKPGATSSSANMELFTALPDSAVRQQVGGWALAPTTGQPDTSRLVTQTTPAGNTQYFVSLNSYLYNTNRTSLNWINCDRFIGMATTNVEVEVHATDITLDNTQVMLVLNTFNGMLYAFRSFSNSSTFFSNAIPLGSTVTAVVLRRENNQLYFGKQTANVGPSHTFRPTLRPVTEAELVAEIQAL
ncbi:hypothetical protein [Hymenobacter sp. AT01-02]|uniref:hypothetical protein n=1 Tax=Hymenobacter sp. AT01-02 TaxID=1571877 RepID=UPI0005F1F57E|nr:hypothetical protein [Hymenobacter sp. AT01-02]